MSDRLRETSSMTMFKRCQRFRSPDLAQRFCGGPAHSLIPVPERFDEGLSTLRHMSARPRFTSSLVLWVPGLIFSPQTRVFPPLKLCAKDCVGPPGILEPDRERVFEPFYQVEDTLHHSKPGMGLDLYIARRAVDAHGGRIWCEPREGGGSAFKFSIPK